MRTHAREHDRARDVMTHFFLISHNSLFVCVALLLTKDSSRKMSSSSSDAKDTNPNDGEAEFQHTHVSRMTSLERILTDTYGVEDKSLVAAIVALGEATAHIAFHLTNYVEHNYAGSQNLSGDEQLELDIHCDEAVFSAVKESGVYSTVASEETPQETSVGTGPFSLGCDPLDGSSIIDANFSVGSIYGIWPGSTLVGRTGREQVAAAVALYGPRTLLCIALAESKQVFEVTLVRNRSEYEVSRSTITIQPNGKIFAPGNLRATTDHKEYNALLQYWLEHRYQLRYSGGMVPGTYVYVFVVLKVFILSNLTYLPEYIFRCLSHFGQEQGYLYKCQFRIGKGKTTVVIRGGTHGTHCRVCRWKCH